MSIKAFLIAGLVASVAAAPKFSGKPTGTDLGHAHPTFAGHTAWPKPTGGDFAYPTGGWAVPTGYKNKAFFGTGFPTGTGGHAAPTGKAIKTKTKKTKTKTRTKASKAKATKA